MANISSKAKEDLLKEASSLKDMSWDSMRNLPYADACFNEVLRMNPPVGGR